MKNILVVPDSLWGNDSGNRSTKFLLKTLASYGLNVSVFADNQNYNSGSSNFLKKNNINLCVRNPYRVRNQIFSYFENRNFNNALNKSKADCVLYFGTIVNKPSTKILIKNKIPYYYLPLTTEYYCLKDWAALEDGPCFKCIKGNYINAYKNDCIIDRGGHEALGVNKFLLFVKKAFERTISRKKILNADRVIAYSDSQLEVLELFGADINKSRKTPIFFDPSQLEKINTSDENYFVVIGQPTVAKGWHLIPEIIKKTKGAKFKLIIYRKHFADLFVKKYKLQPLIDEGVIEIISKLEEHEDVLEVISKSRGVIVSSIYPTTGEFALLESMGLSKPVLVFNSGIHKDIFTDRDNALISDIGDTQKFANDIMELNVNDLLWSRLSAGSLKAYNKLVNFDDFEESIKQIFKKT